MPQGAQAGTAAQAEHEQGAGSARGMTQNSCRNPVPGSAGQKMIPSPPGMNGSGDAELHLPVIAPDGDGLVRGPAGFQMAESGPRHE